MKTFITGTLGILAFSFLFYSITCLTSCTKDEGNYITVSDMTLNKSSNNDNYTFDLTDSDLISVNTSSYNSFVSALNVAYQPLNQIIEQGNLGESESEVSEIMEPVFLEAKQFLLDHGLSEIEFNSEFESDYDDRIISSSLLMLASYEIENQGPELGFIGFITPTVYGYDDTEHIITCISVALGINAIDAIISAPGKIISAKKAIDIIKVVGKRYLGYLGLALAIRNFIKCMNDGAA